MAKIDFPKKQEQRLIPKYLLEYSEELVKNHPDPTAEWGGSGVADIEAGTGIEITGETTKTISVDDETVAMVSNLSTVAFSGSYSNLSDKPDLSVYELKEDAFTGDYADLTNKPDLSVYELKTDAFSGDYNDLTNKPDLSVYAETADLGDCAYLDEDELSIAYSQITGTPTIPTNTSDLNNDSGFITSADISHMVTDNTAQTITANKTFKYYSGSSNEININTYDNQITIDTNTSTTKLDSYGFKNSYISPSPGAIGYTLETSVDGIKYYQTSNESYSTRLIFSDPTNTNTIVFKDDSGTVALTSDIITSYNDLTDKPTIPTATSQLTNDSGFITSSSLPTNYVTTDTNQTNITGTKTFIGDKKIKFKQSISTDRLGFTLYDNSSNEKGYLEYNASDDALFLGRYGNYRVNQLGFKTSGSTIGTHKLLVPNVTIASGATVTDYIPISVNNTKADSSGNISIAIPTVPTNVSAFTNDAGYITGITYADVTTALGYTPGTSNFSGSYTDLTDKPSIPSSATSTSTVTPSTSAFVTGTTTTTETLTFTYTDNTTANITIVTSVTDSTSNAMTGATVSTSTTLS